MADNNEGKQAAPGGEELDESTRQTLEELEKEGHETVLHKKPDEAKPVEDPKPKEDIKPPEEKKPDEGKPKEGDGKPNEEKRRDVTMVEAYKLRIAEGQKAQLEKDLAQAKVDLEKLVAEKSTVKSDTTPPSEDDTTLAKSLAEKHGITEDLAADLVKMINTGKSLPADVTEALKELDNIKKERIQSDAKQQFDTEFKSDVETLIKAEYADIPEDKLSQIKDQLFKLAHSEKYAGTELSVIYKGRDEFRGVVAANKPSAEGSRGGSQSGADTIDFENVTDEDIANMDRPTFEKYSDYMSKKEER